MKHPDVRMAWREKLVICSVYDITKFWRGDHSNIQSIPVMQTDMKQLAGLELTHYFPVPLNEGCCPSGYSLLWRTQRHRD